VPGVHVVATILFSREQNCAAGERHRAEQEERRSMRLGNQADSSEPCRAQPKCRQHQRQGTAGRKAEGRGEAAKGE